jgi:hypothetical protein
MYEGDGAAMNAPGVWMSPQNDDKERLQMHSNAFLHGNAILFHYPFISNNENEIADLIEQAKSYRRTARENLHPEFVETKWFYSGKRRGMKDDRIVSLQLGLFWSSIFYSDEQYCRRGYQRILNGVPQVKLSDNPNSKRKLFVKRHLYESNNSSSLQTR